MDEDEEINKCETVWKLTVLSKEEWKKKFGEEPPDMSKVKLGKFNPSIEEYKRFIDFYEDIL